MLTQFAKLLYFETPGAFTITAPADAATGVSLTPTLQWTASPDAATYSFNLGTDPGFGGGTIALSVNEITATSYVVGSGLNNVGIDNLPLVAGTTYYLELSANNPNGSTLADVISFTVGGEGGPRTSRNFRTRNTRS